jgi:hypothetical protein
VQAGINTLLNNPVLTSKLAGVSAAHKTGTLAPQLLGCLEQAYAKAGSTVIQTGEQADAVFFLVAGNLEVVVERQVLMDR